MEGLQCNHKKIKFCIIRENPKSTVAQRAILLAKNGVESVMELHPQIYAQRYHHCLGSVAASLSVVMPRLQRCVRRHYPSLCSVAAFLLATVLHFQTCTAFHCVLLYSVEVALSAIFLHFQMLVILRHLAY